MVNCAACNKILRGNQLMKCQKCESFYHPLCVNISDYRKKSDTARSIWTCPQCRCTTPRTDNTNKPVRSSVSSNDNDNVSQSNHLSELAFEIKLLRSDVGDLKNHIKSLTDCITQCHQRLDDQEKSLKQAECKIRSLEECTVEIPHLRSTISQLTEQINKQAQAHLKNDLEIMGITETPNENPVHIVLTTALKIGVSLNITDLDVATRVGSHQNTSEMTERAPTEKHPRPLVVKFLHRNKREEFLRAGKSRRNLSTKDLEISGQERKIYINERLTKENRQLFRAARKTSKESGYKYCWVKNGVINIRKREGSPAIAIQNSSDLQRHCPTHLQPKTLEQHC